MLRNWNGYLVRTLNQLASAYHASKPRYQRLAKAAISAGDQRRKRGSRATRKRLSVSALGAVLIGVFIRVILKRFA